MVVFLGAAGIAKRQKLLIPLVLLDLTPQSLRSSNSYSGHGTSCDAQVVEFGPESLSMHLSQSRHFDFASI